MEELFTSYVNPPEPFCKRTAAAGQGTQIGFMDVVGLWVLLAGGLVAAIIIIIAARVANHGARRARPAIEQAVSLVRRRSVSGSATPRGWVPVNGGSSTWGVDGGAGRGNGSEGGAGASNQAEEALPCSPQQQLDAGLVSGHQPRRHEA
jgi:uncharacterized membrane protein YgcG